MEPLIVGGDNFRPVGIAVAPDGSLYCSDWVLRDYPVHGRGRIWRLVLPDDELRTPFPPPSEPDARLPVTRLGELEELRRRGTERAESILREALRDESADVRLFAVRWIADERIAALRDDVARLLDEPPPSRRYYLAVLAAVDWLDHEPDLRSRDISDELLVRELRNERRSPEIQALALGLLSPDHEYLTLDRLRGLLQAEYQPLRLEAARALAQQSNPRRFELLAAVARDETQREEVRAEAVRRRATTAALHLLLRVLTQSRHTPA
jgi:HEAT repeat protein